MSGAPRSNIHAGMFGISGSELQAQEEIVTCPDSSGTHSKQSRPSFVALRDEWDNLSASFIERHNWSTRLEEEKGSLFVTDFFAWMDSDLGFSLDAFEKLGREEFDACLARSDWKQNNEFLGKVNARLWRQYHSIELEFRLGTYKGTPLALRLNGRALGQRETESWLCEYHDIAALNVGPLFGMRYEALDNEIRDFLFVPLGNVFSLREPTFKRSHTWVDTGFIWALEITSTGQNSGSLYVLFNFDNQDRGKDAEIEMMDELDAKFSNGKEYFSLAKVYLDGCPSTQTLERPSSKIEMTPLCKLKPEIAETGLKGDWRDGHPPIALFRPCRA